MPDGAPGIILGDNVSGRDTLHASRYFQPSFLDIPDIWANALWAVSPVAQSSNSALYFYPPLFLPDTIISQTTLPVGCVHPPHVHEDTKVNRYLHNLIRIHDFCCACLFDISMDNHPLTITEWCAALWGDYKLWSSIHAGGQGSNMCHTK